MKRTSRSTRRSSPIRPAASTIAAYTGTRATIATRRCACRAIPNSPSGRRAGMWRAAMFMAPRPAWRRLPRSASSSFRRSAAMRRSISWCIRRRSCRRMCGSPASRGRSSRATVSSKTISSCPTRCRTRHRKRSAPRSTSARSRSTPCFTRTCSTPSPICAASSPEIWKRSPSATRKS